MTKHSLIKTLVTVDYSTLNTLCPNQGGGGGGGGEEEKEEEEELFFSYVGKSNRIHFGL